MIHQPTHHTNSPDDRPPSAYKVCRYTLPREGRHVQYVKTMSEPDGGDDPQRSAFIDKVLARRAQEKADKEAIWE